MTYYTNKTPARFSAVYNSGEVHVIDGTEASITVDKNNTMGLKGLYVSGHNKHFYEIPNNSLGITSMSEAAINSVSETGDGFNISYSLPEEYNEAVIAAHSITNGNVVSESCPASAKDGLVNLSGLPAGMYTIELSVDGVPVESVKIIKKN